MYKTKLLHQTTVKERPAYTDERRKCPERRKPSIFFTNVIPEAMVFKKLFILNKGAQEIKTILNVIHMQMSEKF